MQYLPVRGTYYDSFMFAVAAVVGKTIHYPCMNAMKSVTTGPLGKTNIVFQIRRAVSTMPLRNEYIKDFYQARRFANVGIFL